MLRVIGFVASCALSASAVTAARDSAPLDADYVAAVKGATEAVPYVAASPVEEPAPPVAKLGDFEMIEEAPAITGPFLDELKRLVTDQIPDTGMSKSCGFDPTVGYRFRGPRDVAVVICHGCATAIAILDGKTVRFEIDPVQSELLTIAGQLFPEEPRLHAYRHREIFSPYDTGRIVREAERAETYVGRPDAESSRLELTTLGDSAMLLAGPELTGTLLERLRGVLLDPGSVTFSANKRCRFDPTVGYVFESREGRVEIVFGLGCQMMSITTRRTRPRPGADGSTRYVDVDPAHAEFLEIAHEIFPEEPRIARYWGDR